MRDSALVAKEESSRSISIIKQNCIESDVG
jgi:hypothetical protein